jgi:hypothetical protein
VTTKNATDPLAEHLQTVRDESLANARALLTEDGPEMPMFPRRLQIEQNLIDAESAQRRLDLFKGAM